MGVILCVPSEQEAFAQFPPLTYNGRGHDTYLTLGQRCKKIRVISFVDNYILIIFHEFHIDRVNTVVMVPSQFFYEVRSLKVTW